MSYFVNFSSFYWLGDCSVMYQMGFQDPATTIMEGIYVFNPHLLFVTISIVLFVSWLLFKIFENCTKVNKLWTISPGINSKKIPRIKTLRRKIGRPAFYKKKLKKSIFLRSSSTLDFKKKLNFQIREFSPEMCAAVADPSLFGLLYPVLLPAAATFLIAGGIYFSYDSLLVHIKHEALASDLRMLYQILTYKDKNFPWENEYEYAESEVAMLLQKCLMHNLGISGTLICSVIEWHYVKDVCLFGIDLDPDQEIENHNHIKKFIREYRLKIPKEE